MPKRILLVYTNYSSFVKQDYEILAEHNQVDKYLFKLSKKAPTFAWQFIRQLVYLIVLGWKYDVFFIWFADYHSLLPSFYAKLFSKKSLIIVGGFDAVSYPSLSYGVFEKKNSRYFFAIHTYKLATYILPVSNSLIRSVNTHVDPPNKIEGGITYFVNNIEHKIKTIFTAFDEKAWDPSGIIKKENSVLTVGIINDIRTFYIKGIDLYIETARQLPHYNFVIVGMNRNLFNILSINPPNNLICAGYLHQNELYTIFKETLVYAQFSVTEGLPSVLCEAMLAGCIPVGTNVGGIPELIKDRGYLIETREVEEAKAAIVKAFETYQTNPLFGIESRLYISKNCNIRKREEEILKLL